MSSSKVKAMFNNCRSG